MLMHINDTTTTNIHVHYYPLIHVHIHIILLKGLSAERGHRNNVTRTSQSDHAKQNNRPTKRLTWQNFILKLLLLQLNINN